MKNALADTPAIFDRISEFKKISFIRGSFILMARREASEKRLMEEIGGALSPNGASYSPPMASFDSSSMICIVDMALSAPKGRDKPAQGIALGSIAKNIPSPDRARQRLCRPFRA